MQTRVRKRVSSRKLGEYYNSHFINYKIDAESPAGKEFVKSYPITGYPTFSLSTEMARSSIRLWQKTDGFIAEAK
ncbi:MAG: hypothetical protein ACLU4N_12340 [Butyricimonas faecihominis]